MTTERVIVEQRQGIRFRPALVFETTPPKTAEERFRLCVAGTVLFDVIGDNRFCGFDKNCFFRGAMYGNQDVLGSPTSQPTIGETVADELNRIVVTEEASPARLRSTIELRQRLAELLTGELLSGADATIAYVAAPTPPRGDRSESYFWLNGGGAGEYRITVYDNEREVFEMRAGSVETFIQFCPPRTAFGTYDHSHPDVTLS